MALDSGERTRRAAVVLVQYNGIFPAYEAFYLHSIIYAADRSHTAFSRFDDAVEAEEPPSLTMALVQEALTHAGALSRFFWPMGKSELAAARGRRLQEAFNVGDDSSLKSRVLRNAFEHFDEDLDQFLLNDPSGCFFPAPVIEDHHLADEAMGNIFKLVDPVNEICVLLGRKFWFRPIRTEVEHLLTAAHTMTAQGSVLRRAPPK